MVYPSNNGFRHPFGELSCEHEIETLGNDYQNYYYDQSRFNAGVLDPETYLIVGRRGSGKTSLAKYFKFQSVVKNACCIDVDEPDVYNDILQEIAAQSSYSTDLNLSRIVKIWEYVIWSLIINEYQSSDKSLAFNGLLMSQKGKPAYIVKSLLKDLVVKYVGAENAVLESIEESLLSAGFNETCDKILNLTANTPVFVAMDTIERYDRNDEILMQATAGLIQCASNFNMRYSRRGIHVKAFVSAEIFPHLKEAAITNTAKFIRQPVYLYWRPRDLIRLICWRFYRYLELLGHHAHLPTKPVRWDIFSDVLEKMWFPFFGENIRNNNGVTEKSFPYIIRHTQMRPRQLVILCNEIARKSNDYHCYPHFYKLDICSVIKDCERDLADEVLNSYAKIYPRVAEIVDALRTFPAKFDGNLLDKAAHTTAFAWPKGEYSPDSFCRLVAELGIVGRVRNYDERSSIVEADFEYTLTDRLALRSTDKCVIHPMFYSKLQIQNDQKLIVLPFPDNPEFHELTNHEL